jgi:hypothetical protein
MPGVPGIGVRSAHRPGGTGTKEITVSMTRTKAIKYFALSRFDGKTIAQAVELAPIAVGLALHPKDHAWIERHPYTSAWGACQRLQARGLANPEGVVDIAPRPDDKIIITAPAGTKARWVHQSQSEGVKLSDWIVKKVDQS